MTLMTERHHSPAAERNQAPILAQLKRLLPTSGLALEVASGTGQHAAHFARHLPGWQWQPTEAHTDAFPSITSWCDGLPNVAPPRRLDVLDDLDWAQTRSALAGPLDAVFCANLLHISPWSTCAALMRGADLLLANQGVLLLYGPYVVEGVETSAGNLAFDADLRARNAAWGLRSLAAVAQQAQARGLVLRERIAMPANNLLLVFARAGLRPRLADA